MTEQIERWRQKCTIGLVCFYGIAGLLHVMWPIPFLEITPGWVPAPRLVIFVTGLCEIVGAAGLLIPALRRTACFGLALYAVCVFPANIKHALDILSGEPSMLQWAYHICRLPFQPVIVWVALFASGVLTWPMRRVER